MEISKTIDNHPLLPNASKTIDNQPLLLNANKVAAMLDVSISTIRKWSCSLKDAPPGFPDFLRIGGRVFVRRADLEAWVAGLRGQSNPEPALPRRRGRPRKWAA